VIAPDFQPPAADRGHREGRRLVRDADHHVPRVPADVVYPVRDAAAQRPAGEVVVEDLPAAAPPAAAGVLEWADQLLLLGIHADHGQAPRQIPAPYPGQVAELPVAVGVARPRQALADGPQGEALLLEQAGQGAVADGQPALAQGRTQLADRLVRPPHPRHRVTGDGVAHQVLQGRQDVRAFFFRPAVGRHRVGGYALRHAGRGGPTRAGPGGWYLGSGR